MAIEELERFVSYTDSFKKKNISVVGDIFLDRFNYGIARGENPEMPAAPLLKMDGEAIFFLGGAGNVASNLAKFGANVRLYGLVGAEENGRLLESERDIPLAFNNIYNEIIYLKARMDNISLIKIHHGKTILKERNLERTQNHYIMRHDEGEYNMKLLSPEQEEKIINSITGYEKPDAIILTDYDKYIFKGSIGLKIIEWANSNDIPSFVDPKKANIAKFSKAYCIKPNEKEARSITDLYNSEINDVAKKLFDSSGAGSVVITRGARGILAYDGKFYDSPTKAKHIIDVTGAGDTVIAVLALSRISGATLDEAIQFANYAAGIVIEKPGTSTLTCEELIKSISKG